MDDQPNATPIEAQPAKKQYVMPQLHVLSGEDAEGKQVIIPNELDNTYGPS